MKELWEGPKDEKQNVALYVIQMRNRLEEMTALAHQNMEMAQKKQKTWYDRKSRERTFVPGQKVLLLLPTDDRKLLAKWHGPYEITKKVGDVTYEVSMPERGKKKQTFHINLLKEFHSREQMETQLFVRAVIEVEEPEEQFFPVKTTSQTVDLSHLEEGKQHQVKKLLDPSLFQERPGRATAVEHDIILRPDTSPQRKSYRVPERFSLRKAKYIYTIDLSRGYWQVPLRERAKEVTAFRTPFGLYHFRVMPFGLQGAPASFQRLMDGVLEGVHEFAAAYLDDVVIYSNNWQDHMYHLKQVLGRIREAGLTINPKKCSLAKKEVSYLGYVIGNGVIRPQVEKVEAIRSCTPPTTKKKVRSFLGLMGWYRRFIPNFSERSSPLSDLTSLGLLN